MLIHIYLSVDFVVKIDFSRCKSSLTQQLLYWQTLKLYLNKFAATLTLNVTSEPHQQCQTDSNTWFQFIINNTTSLAPCHSADYHPGDTVSFELGYLSKLSCICFLTDKAGFFFLFCIYMPVFQCKIWYFHVISLLRPNGLFILIFFHK